MIQSSWRRSESTEPARRAHPSTRFRKSHSLRSRPATDGPTRAWRSAASWALNRRRLTGATSTIPIATRTS
eukprot:3961186-Prymnesium_polylepis.1